MRTIFIFSKENQGAAPDHGRPRRLKRTRPSLPTAAFWHSPRTATCSSRHGRRRVSQLTADGSEEILNGYASWIYYEEILGRAGRYKAFNWSPDSGKIAFMRFDQCRVPQFPLFDAAGAYGRLEMQRYPKPGFPNPEVKIGVIDLAGRQTDWIAFPAEVDHYLTFLAWARTGKVSTCNG